MISPDHTLPTSGYTRQNNVDSSIACCSCLELPLQDLPLTVAVAAMSVSTSEDPSHLPTWINASNGASLE